MKAATAVSFWKEGKHHLILAVIAIITISYGLFFYFQTISENNIKNALFHQQEQRQADSTEAIAEHIESDLHSLASRLEALARSSSFQNIDDPSHVEIRRSMAQKVFTEINTDSQSNTGSLVENLYAIDKEGLILIDVHEFQSSAQSPDESNTSFEGINISSMEYLQETRAKLSPVFSKGYVGLDGKYRVAVAYPIIDEKSGAYAGAIAAVTHTASFFQHYGNIHDIESQYLAVLDKDSVQLIHPVQSLIGTPFFGEYTQEVTGRIESLNSLVRNVMSGQPGHAVYEFKNGERLTTGHPIFLGGEPTYFVFVITPTTTIYASIDSMFLTQRVETSALLAGTTAAIFVLIMLLVTWNSNLRKEVAARTNQLIESNKQLSLANERLLENYEQLKASEKMQKEFIDIAAHELRTPIQPIIGLSDILISKTSDPESRVLLDAVRRSASRLNHLSSDILDVSRIESRSFHITKSEFDFIGLAASAVEMAKSQLQNANVEIIFNHASLDAKALWAFADPERIHQVLSNLLGNAMKFTDNGTITVEAKMINIDDGSNQVIEVKVTDTGTGIDPEILPKLFTKFTTKSEQGTGLGLFISKSIIEAHGGQIWAKNNESGKGATFAFTIPAARTKAPDDHDYPINTKVN